MSKTSGKAKTMKTATKRPKAAKPVRRTAKKAGTPKRVAKGGRVAAAKDGVWNLRLYVAGQSPKSQTALNNLKKLCDRHMPGQYQIEVIDLMKNPQLAQVDQILAIPTLVRKIPEPMKRVIGDLSDEERTMLALDVRKVGE